VPLVVYSLLRLALVAACWAALVWAGLDPLVAVVVAALLAWGLSYVTMRGPRDAAARWLAEQDARRRAGVSTLSARAQQDASDEDAQVDAADARPVPGHDGPDGDADAQSASPSPSSTP
jgi:hypothetical protein